MKKILYITNSRIPTEKAHGKQIMETCHALARQGVEVELLIPQRVNKIKKNPFEYYGLEQNFRIKKIFSLDLLFLPFCKKIFFGLQMASFFISSAIYSTLQTKKFEVIYTRDLLAAAMLRARPVFFEIHDIPAKIGFWQRRAWRKAKVLVVISEGLKNKLISEGVLENKILIARDAVDIDKFSLNISQEEARKKLNIFGREKIVLYTGHLYSWKGSEALARAAGFLGPGIKTYLVGGTDEEINDYQKKFQASNLKIIGHRPPEEIPLWLKSADLLILPNSAKEDISSKYTSPLKLFEYMASGTPIVASDLSSLREVLTDEEAIFFRPDDVEDLVRIIKIALVNPNILHKISKNARAKAESFSWSGRAKIILDKCKTI